MVIRRLGNQVSPDLNTRSRWHPTWCTADCKSCAEFDFKSGDVLIFDGSPAADVAHGVLDTLAGTGPAELPDWAKGCAVSLQYRQRRK